MHGSGDTMTFDLLLRGGTVVDGTGSRPFPADVGVARGRITAVDDDLSAAAADTVLDVTGLVVTPGLIDAHIHSDLASYLPAECTDTQLANVRQGVTTEVSGNCGLTPFPFVPSPAEPSGTWMGAPLFGSLRDYRTALSERPLVNNLAPLVGHNRIRSTVMGLSARTATDDELAAMVRLVAEAMDDGAFGMSTGLVYTPGSSATTAEIVALATEVGRRGRIYATHMRNESDGVLDAIDEALGIGRAAGVAVQISHHKLSGRPNWGRSNETLAHLDAARSAGADVTLDVYPYTASSAGLSAVLPTWVTADGPAEMRTRLTDRDIRSRITADLFALPAGNVRRALAEERWASVRIAGAPRTPELEGLTIPEIAEQRCLLPLDALCELVLEGDGLTMMVSHTMSQQDVDAISAQPYAMGGSDGTPFMGKQHPRGAGTFARWLAAAGGDGVRLADRVHRVTGLTAERFGIPDRGVLRTGAVADLCVFDPVTVADRADYVDHLARPNGIAHVAVAGELVIRDAVDTGRRPGCVLEPV
jgi:N-acyl-D-amino-acid deacylase